MRPFLFALLLACNGGEKPAAPESATAPATAPESTAAPAPVSVPAPPPVAARPQPESNISLGSVEAGNPIIVTGRARTFENNVALRVRDASGRVITETFTTADGEMGQHNLYRGTLWLTRDPGGRVTVEALEYSAKDGSEQSLIRAVRPYGVELVDLRLDVPNEDCTATQTIVRPAPKSISAARLHVEALLTHEVFPKGSAVRSINLRDGVLTVDFNERLQNVGGSCAALMIRESVTKTLSRLPNVRKVVITAGGSESLALQP